jgi:hypothetical protein
MINSVTVRGFGWRGWRGLATGGEVLGDEAVVFLLTLGRAVRAEVVVLAADRDDGTVTGLVEAVFGVSLAGHGAVPEKPFQYGTGRVWLSRHTADSSAGVMDRSGQAGVVVEPPVRVCAPPVRTDLRDTAARRVVRRSCPRRSASGSGR